MARDKIYSSYLHHQERFRDKWKIFQGSAMEFDEKHYVPELTPLFGTRDFDRLSLQDRHKLFFEYTKFVAEAFILFEQILLYGVWHLKKIAKKIDPTAYRSLMHFANEELYHTQGFRHFLSSTHVLNWSNLKIYSDAYFLKNAIAFVIRLAPACIFLPGAKLEAFTLSYYRMIKKHYPNQEDNSWAQLNYYHHLDENFHLPLEFDLHDSIIDNAGLIRTLTGSIFFVLIMQVALIQGSYRLVANVFPQYGFIKKISWMLKMSIWAVRTTPAYKDARAITKQQFQKKKPKWGKVLAFIYW